jgi:hypothetical protein
MTDYTRASELLDREQYQPKPAQVPIDLSGVPHDDVVALLESAFVAGYRARELDTRADDKLTRKIAERKFDLWMKGQQHD